MRRKITYADAVRILGGTDSQALDLINNLLTGTIIAATAVTGKTEYLAFLDVRDQMITQTQKLLSRLSDRTTGSRGKTRTDLLVAAHAVVAINAYFEVVRDSNVPALKMLASKKNRRLKASDQFIIAGNPSFPQSSKLVQNALTVPVPTPAPHLPYEKIVAEMLVIYKEMSERLLALVTSQGQWNALDATERTAVRQAIEDVIPSRATARYQDDVRTLAAAHPEVALWIQYYDAIATRKTIESGFAQLQETFQSLVRANRAQEWSAALSRHYQADVRKALIDTSPDEAYDGLSIPIIADAYIVPSCRVAEYNIMARPAENEWWRTIPPRSDMANFVAGHLSSDAAWQIPLVVLGEPGSGKSLFTRVLAASLPSEDYLAVRVELRRFPSDASIRRQIEAGLAQAANEHMEWAELVRSADGAMPVVLLDGFDELLQLTRVSHSNYLEEVHEFQCREAEHGRHVAVIVTSRIVAASRVRFIDGTVIAKIEPFSDADVTQWLDAWNRVNKQYLDRRNMSRLSLQSLGAHRDLASQPLLLLMLALYDADNNALQSRAKGLARGQLYEQLLTKFIAREVAKLYPTLDREARQAKMAEELQRLSVLALGMFNRGSKALNERQLDSDMSELGSHRETTDVQGKSSSAALTQGQLIVGRFFFVYKSQAYVNDEQLRGYEFLHSTFGEYLVARVIFLAMERIVKIRMADSDHLRVGMPATGTSYDELWSLLSFSPLTDGSQTLSFLTERIQSFGEHNRAELLIELQRAFRDSLWPRQGGYHGYQPMKLDATRRHAAYSANLFVVISIVTIDHVRATDLFDRDDPIGAWRSMTLLWRSQLGSVGWQGLVNCLHIRHMPADRCGTIEIVGAHHARSGAGISPIRSLVLQDSDSETDPAFIAKQADFMCLPEVELLEHGIAAIMSRDPQMLTQLLRRRDGTTQSVLNEAMSGVWRQVAEEGARVRGTAGLEAGPSRDPHD